MPRTQRTPLSRFARPHRRAARSDTAHRRRCRCPLSIQQYPGQPVSRASRCVAQSRGARAGPRDAGRRDAASTCIVGGCRAPRCRTASVLHRTTSVPRCVGVRRRRGRRTHGPMPRAPCAAGVAARRPRHWHGACVTASGRINGDPARSTEYRRARQRASWATASYAPALARRDRVRRTPFFVWRMT